MTRRGRPVRGRRVKRLMDVVVAGTLLVVLAPLMLIIAWRVRSRLGSPVFFTQTRLGRFGAPFKILKFRSMRDARDETGVLLPDDMRLTGFGERLRRTSLDELPELLNVLRGDMSLVGPRPLIPEYLPFYSPFEARRHLAKPGVTGLAQVSGRNAISWPEKFSLDVYYVDHQSLWLDVKILARTFHHVAMRDGISTEGYLTSPNFAEWVIAGGRVNE
jgi:lipopolysaccharide/colanic/teichoic acid biosynthesis glycosyltransferase